MYSFTRVARCPNVGESRGRPATTLSKRKKSILPQPVVISIVDDDEEVREATKGLVRSLGYTAATFGSAEEFLNSEQRYDTSCIIADVQMPGLSGVEMQKQLIAEGHRLPMIFVTAFPEDRVRASAMEAGAVGFLSKPCNEEHLIGCLDSALGRRRAGSRES
jgi:FixJ family two-component response regulator